MGCCTPTSQMPLNLASMAAWSGVEESGAKDGFSGQMPESRSATMMPRPELALPPNCFCQTPLEPSRPRNLGVETVSAVRTSTGQTFETPGVFESLAAWDLVSLAEKPLNATE